MEFFHFQKDIPFMRYAKVFNTLSVILFILSFITLIHKGLNFSIEFTGGTVIEAHYAHAADLNLIRHHMIQLGIHDPSVQNYGSSTNVLIRLPQKATTISAISVDSKIDSQLFQQKVLQQSGPVSIQRIEYVGPEIGKELAQNGLIALLFVCIGICIYLSIRFEWRFSLSAIIANLHDVIIILGFFSFFQWEFSLPVLAAVLAVLGYSVNESVVVFDRIRETFKKRRDLPTTAVIDHAITTTMSRTIITHVSTQLMVTSMLFLGGETLRYFSAALTIGILFSIYSSVLVSSPLLLWMRVSREQFEQKKETIDRNDPNAGAVV